MKQMFTDYFERTIVPAITMGWITTLGQYFMNYNQTGCFYVSFSQMTFSFFLFIVVMTIEDAWDFWKEVSEALDMVG